MMTRDPDITALLQSLHDGDSVGLGQVLALVYEQLHRLASRYMRHERIDHTLRTTALVHEACLRIFSSEMSFENRVHLLAVASTAMRRILVDHARTVQRGKRGGGAEKLSLEAVENEQALLLWTDPAQILDLNEALEQLALQDARKARLMEMHYFGGLTCDEAAVALAVSVATVNRDLKLARAWLRQALNAPVSVAE
jgi:RNA polymerase sigma factor (TIGR02999 family)